MANFFIIIIILVVVLQYPVETYLYALVFSITGYLGVNIVLTLVKSFGALPAVTGDNSWKVYDKITPERDLIKAIVFDVSYFVIAVTTGRKAVTIVLSFLFFTKPFTMQ